MADKKDIQIKPPIPALNELTILHSVEFVNQWRKLLHALYGYSADKGALVVHGVTGAKQAVYLPLLSYTDIDKTGAESMIGGLVNKRYQFRVLDGTYQTFVANDPVTMRMALDGSSEEILKSVVGPKCRNHIRKSEKMGLIVKEGPDDKIISDFYTVFSETMHRHGTPVFDRRLFELLPKFVDARFLVVYHQDKPIAGLCLVFDEKLAWVPWAGSLVEHRLLKANHLQYWSAIKMSLLAGAEVFDFGRSAYLGPTYQFKADWGAKPVKILLLASEHSDVYSKYSLAADVWKKLPTWMVSNIGPRLCRFLPDL